MSPRVEVMSPAIKIESPEPVPPPESVTEETWLMVPAIDSDSEPLLSLSAVTFKFPSINAAN